MGYTILIAGKGGTGKTTLAALLVRIIKEKNLGSVLAVDADPNSNLGEALGIAVTATVSGILDDIAAHPEKIPPGMVKERFIEYQVQAAVQEGEGFDIITMGKPEGPGCYCYVNNVLRNTMGKLVNDYKYIVIDNEAGLEHLSRRTTRSADTLLVVSDATPVGLKAAQRIAGIVKEIGIKAKSSLLLINRAEREIEGEKTKNTGLEYLGTIPADEGVAQLSLRGGSLWDLNDTAVSMSALKNIGDKILSTKV
jgi:CO dehydrogenase maturation factor